ncbi:hypothetical protein DFH09DRAFT_869580, partial [Mycena vulgaris]
WYDPDGNYGAYGAPMQNSNFIVALSSAPYHNALDVTIGDLCPGRGTEDLDLSQGAFADLADLDLGRIAVQWHF